MNATAERDYCQTTDERLDDRFYVLLLEARSRALSRRDWRRAKMFSMNAAKLRSRMVTCRTRPPAVSLARTG